MLTERDMEILGDLRFGTDQSIRFEMFDGGYCRPLDCGGSNSSDHSYRLAKLTRAGLAERRRRSIFGSRGAWLYRITEAGRKALEEA